MHESLQFPTGTFCTVFMCSKVHSENGVNVLLLERLLSFKQLLFKTHTIFWYRKSKKSVATTVFQFQKFFIK